MKIPLFFNNTARSARAGRFRRWLERYGSVFDVVEPESSEDMLNRLGEFKPPVRPGNSLGMHKAIWCCSMSRGSCSCCSRFKVL